MCRAESILALAGNEGGVKLKKTDVMKSESGVLLQDETLYNQCF